MKTGIKTIWILLLSSLVVSCTEQLYPSISVDTILSGETKSPSSDYYYWYNGQRVDLTVNEDYVNILVDTTKVKNSDIAELSSDLSLEVKSEINADGLFKAGFQKTIPEILDYEMSVERLRHDERILCVLPFFEVGKGKEPIGTAQYFFVQLKELSPEDTPYLEKVFDFDALQEESERLGVRVVNEVAYMPDWYRMTIEGSGFKTTIEAANRFYETGRFEAIDPAFLLKLNLCATNDSYYGQQWGLKNTVSPGYDINVEGAWTISTGSGIEVAVFDSAIHHNHQDLSSNINSVMYDVSTGSPYTFSIPEYHGTHIAGIIGAETNNGLDIAGIAYDANIIPVKITEPNPFGPGSTPDSIASAIHWAWIYGADVINCSWNYTAGNSQILDASIVNALNYGRTNKGAVVVFASGNDGNSAIGYPANVDNRILTVGAMDNSGYRDLDSNYGAQLDAVAPGVDIISTIPFDLTGTDSGTSMAAAHVSGVAALMLQANLQLTVSEISDIIHFTAKKIHPNTYTFSASDSNSASWNQEVGYGLVDATAAVSMAHAFATVPSVSDPGMDVTLISGPVNDQHFTTINGGYFPEYADILLLPPYVNSAYTYYWHITTNTYPNWQPSIEYSYGSHAVIKIPAPITSSTLYIKCFVFNGSTLVGVPSYTITANP
ncbi:MAG: S8 family serine peptidase [Bacteroidales bacterium]|nr:S8 family serine peptidase [Bacteroidales bacterium]